MALAVVLAGAAVPWAITGIGKPWWDFQERKPFGASGRGESGDIFTSDRVYRRLPSRCQLFANSRRKPRADISQVIRYRCPWSPKSSHTAATVSPRESPGAAAAKGFREFSSSSRVGTGKTLDPNHPPAPLPRLPRSLWIVGWKGCYRHVRVKLSVRLGCGLISVAAPWTVFGKPSQRDPAGF